MKEVHYLNICNVNLEYCIDDYVYIYNPKNERMLQADQNTLDYLISYNVETSEKVEGLEKFLFGNKKCLISNFKLLTLSVSTKGFETLYKMENIRFLKYLFLCLLIIFGTTLPFVIREAYTFYNSDSIKFNVYHLLYIYMAQLFIILFHEFSHYYTYRKYINSNNMRFGITIRYFFVVLFFTNVNYMRTLESRQKISIMLSGIVGQMILGSLLSLIYFLSNSDVILYIYLINLIIICINVMPFLKLDGYWIINLIIGSEDYMEKFKKFILNRQKIKSSELLLGLVNFILITIVILSGVCWVFDIVRRGIN
ncbi:peptidase M50 [Bacillus thuringiensis]|uniref:peptidase M50 n=1 Tax=Bacillus thuringiensis TaxID=1428 RepID=UPI000B42E7E8|nr:peptidase M50 [Bacillus thuringiensis]MCU4957526.1 peptidase M50 [Bacillus cereus]MED3180870.1 peptidase M50 [Bacillus thuringiensis]OTX99641.1 peptidase M50 [Bacillus thuringiensis serovar kim]OUB12793.1 peptidase M50 [Bacillus thuringiensis serovar xiaguangiensis]